MIPFLQTRPKWQPQSAKRTLRNGTFGQDLRFAYVGSQRLQDMGPSKLSLSRGSAATFQATKDGVALFSTAANAYAQRVLASSEMSMFLGDVTLMWRGVVIGNYTEDNANLFCIAYGDGNMGAPNVVVGITRGVTENTIRTVASNGNGREYVDHSVNLSALYGKTVSFVFSNVAGTNAHTLVVVVDGVATTYAGTSASASDNPRPVIPTLNYLYVGGIPGTQIPNVATTGAFIWTHAKSAAEMKQVGLNPAAFFSSSKQPRHTMAYTPDLSPYPLLVKGFEVTIPDGGGSPSPDTGTLFGYFPVNSTGVSRTFGLVNVSENTYILDNILVPDGFSITTSLVPELSVGASANIVIEVKTSSTAGPKAGDVRITGSGLDQYEYTFPIEAYVYASAPAPYRYPTFAQPREQETLVTVSSSVYYVKHGGIYHVSTSVFIQQLYELGYYWDNYFIENNILYRTSPTALYAVRSAFSENFENVVSVVSLFGPSRGWNQMALQEAAASTGLQAVQLGSTVINGGAFISNTIRPSASLAHSGTQSLKVFCEGASAIPITKSAIACGLLHFAEGDELWAKFYVYIESGKPLGLIDFECTPFNESPGIRLLLNSSYVPRIQLKSGDFPTWNGTNPLPTGAWVEIKMRIGLDLVAGVVKMWVNGVLEIDGTGKTLPLASAVYDRVQLGVTAHGDVSATTVFLDDLRVGRSELDLTDPTGGLSNGARLRFSYPFTTFGTFS